MDPPRLIHKIHKYTQIFSVFRTSTLPTRRMTHIHGVVCEPRTEKVPSRFDKRRHTNDAPQKPKESESLRAQHDAVSLVPSADGRAPNGVMRTQCNNNNQ